MDLRFLLVLGCVLLSGMAGLVYQTAWTQQFALTFGASELAVVAVLTAYMAGLTAGALAAARWLGRVRRPVLAYGLLEMGIALCALAVPAALELANRLQLAVLGGRAAPPAEGGLGTVAFHLAASLVVLLPPTALMGATLPLLVRHAVRCDDELGARVGTLYTVNTLGAALGTLAAGFLLLPALGLARTVWVGVALNALAFLLAIPLFRSTAVAVSRTGDAPLAHRYVLPLMLVSSAVSFTYEVMWTRLLTFVLGGSVYAFATMLATFLTGIALGAAVAARMGRTGALARRGFALAQLGTALASLFAFHLVDRLPHLSQRLAAAGMGPLPAGGLLSAVTLLPGAVCIGATFPFAVRILAGHAEQAGPATARAYAWSTVGAVLGAVVGGLWVLPALRYEGTAAALFVTSALLAVAAALGGRPRSWPVAALAGAALLALAVIPPRAPWDLLRHSSLLADRLDGSVAFFGVGRGATVVVLDQGGEWLLASNGLPEAAIQGPGSRLARYAGPHWLSLLAVAARPEARSLLVVGLGAGKTIEDVPPSIESIDVVELEPEIVRANQALAGRRMKDPLADPRVHLRLNDARSALLLTERRFDAIVSQPSHPWTAGAAHLFTREFFSLVRDRLSDDGVFVVWMGKFFLDEPLLRSLLATLRAVFPHVEAYDPQPGGSLLFLAARQPLRLAETAGRAIAAAPVTWAAQGVVSVEDVLAIRVQDEAGVATVAEGAPLITDGHNLLQTRSPHILKRALGVRGTDRVFAPYDPLRRAAAGPEGARLVRRFLRQKRLARARRMAGAMSPGRGRRVAEALIALATGARAQGEAALLAVFRESPRDGDALRELLVLRLDDLARGEDPDGLMPAVAADPLARAVLEGWRGSRMGRMAEVRELEAVLAQARPHEPLYETALRLRLGWRYASGEARLAREAIALLDPFMADGANARDALLRARLAVAAGDRPAAFASLLEIADVGLRVSEFQATARDGLKLIDELQAAGGMPAPEGLRERLVRSAEGSLPSPLQEERPPKVF